MSPRPAVVVLTLGGTIASSAEPGEGATIRVSGEELLLAVPAARSVADIEVRTVRMMPSADLTLADIFSLRTAVEKAIGDGAAGIVVTQGTDTLEETSYALDLLTNFAEPVVFTGAMRHISVPGTDAPANVLSAIRVAAAQAARGLGVVVVFNDEIHAARFVRKRHTAATSTFGSPVAGPLGWVSEDRVRVLTRPAGRLVVPTVTADAGCRVAQLMTYFDDDGDLLSSVPRLGYRGLVLSALGGGHVPSRLAPVLGEISEQIPVVLASRTNSGEVLRATYAYPGGEMDVIGRGLIPSCGLDAAHSAVLLRLLLMANVPRDALAAYFEQAVSGVGMVTG